MRLLCDRLASFLGNTVIEAALELEHSNSFGRALG